MRFTFVIFLGLLFPSVLYSNDKIKKEIEAIRIINAPKIDAVLDDQAWEDAGVANDFFQLMPFNGKPCSFNSEVRILYDDEALYIGAILSDPNPDSIVKILTQRDELSDSDFFGVYLDPFNDGLNAYGFFVTAAGVQTDMRNTSGSMEIEDESWDAVWESAVQIVDQGWVVEMKIPYSALRFPKENTENWGLNIFRNIRRYREYVSWNYIDRKQTGMLSQAGLLSGVKDVEPPVRLSFTPYLATYLNKYSGNSDPGYSIKGGLDLKYGLTESFTLDMMLIPDFGQVESDDEILNLTPFETYYDEKRAFFTEGGELFDKAEIFYSRRIGGRPNGYSEAEDRLNENEKLIKNPAETQLLNATKVSGKTRKGLSVGFLNAVSKPMFATARDTLTGEIREIKTQDLTNYNITVVEQALRNNSYLSFINTNMNQAGNPFRANVLGIDHKLVNNANRYAVYVKGAWSRRLDEGIHPENGYYYDLDVSKIQGQFLASLSRRMETHNYNPNDLGFIRANNEISNRLRLSYNFYEPFWILRNLYNSVFVEYSTLYLPREFREKNIGLRSRMTFNNYLTFGFVSFYQPEAYDWFEPRVEGYKMIEPGYFYNSAFFSSDYRKPLALNAEITHRQSFEYGSEFLGLSFGPRIRINDNFFVNYSIDDNKYKNDLGYIDHTEQEDSIYMGRRDVNTLINTLNANYTFSTQSSLSFRVRHYWSSLQYKDYYLLQENGRLKPNEGYTADGRNFNALNIDMVYTWIFAPGSEITIVWKNSIETDEEYPIEEFSENIRSTFAAPQFNSLSFKILYYLDYNYLKKKG